MQNLLNDTRLVIFDMDGLLIDSEPYWKIAEKKVFGELGLDLTDDLLRQVMGFRLSEVVRHWHAYKPWENADFDKTELYILDTVQELIVLHAEALPGVHEILKSLKQQGFKMAVASSSPMRLIEAVLAKLNIASYFDVVKSAQYEEYGKPHPALFLNTAKQLGVNPSNCLVFEDAINGVIAAKAAKMKCVAVPEHATINDPRFAIADLKLSSLAEFETGSKTTGT